MLLTWLLLRTWQMFDKVGKHTIPVTDGWPNEEDDMLLDKAVLIAS